MSCPHRGRYAEDFCDCWVCAQERRESVMDFDNKVFCWLTFAVATAIVVAILWPRGAPAADYTCWHVAKGVEIAGTSDPAGLERAARAYGIPVTPALRRLVRSCLGRSQQLAAKRSFSTRR